MDHRLLRDVLMPVIFYSVFLFGLIILTTFLDLVNAPGGLLNTLNGFLACYALGVLVLLIVWWGFSLARWLYERFHWEILPYAIINIMVGFGLGGVSVAVASGLDNFIGALAYLLVFAGFLAGGFWVVRSGYELVVRSGQVDGSIYATLLKADAVSLNRLSDFFSPVKGETLRLCAPTQAPKRQKRSLDGDPVFRQVSIGGQKADHRQVVAIPPRPASPSPPSASLVSRPAESYPPSARPQITFSSSSSSDFVKEAKRYAHRTQASANPVPFMQYWPTYSSMSKAQQKWYFYWRTQLRQGNWLTADTSYLFVYVYEIINVIGFDSPKLALDRLINFWEFYRKLQPKLDHYLPDWIADFTAIHKLTPAPLEWYRRVAQLGVPGDEDLQLEAWLQTGHNFKLLAKDLIYRLSGYNPTRNKFYKQYGQALNLDAAYETGLQAVNSYVEQRSKQTLFGLYQDRRTRLVTRPPFASALHAYKAREIEIAVVRPWMGNEPLGKALKDILKYTENVVREHSGYRYKLREVKLPLDWQQAIEAALAGPSPRPEVEIDWSQPEQLSQDSSAIQGRLSTAERPAADLRTSRPPLETQKEQPIAPSEPPAVQPVRDLSIDFAAVDKVRRESDQIRDRLSVETGFSEGRPDLEIAPAPKDQEAPQGAEEYLIRPDGTADHLLTSLAEIASILGGFETEGAGLLRVLRQNSWHASLEDIQSRLNGQFANVVIDQINERAYHEVGDVLVIEVEGVWTVNEEYRDEVEYILSHPAYQPKQTGPAAEPPLEKYRDLRTDWQEFVRQMQPCHWDALAALLSGAEVQTRLDAIAKPLHKTGNLLVDEINEYAQESVGDIVVDTVENPPRILEDEQDTLAQLLSWAVSQRVIEV